MMEKTSVVLRHNVGEMGSVQLKSSHELLVCMTTAFITVNVVSNEISVSVTISVFSFFHINSEMMA